MGRREGLVLLCAFLMAASGGGQVLVLNDSMELVNIKNALDPEHSLVRYHLKQELEYSCAFSNVLFLNWQQGDNANLVSFLHHIKYLSQVSNNKNVTFRNTFMHDLGIEHFFDSISRFRPDENTMDTQVEFRIGKNLSFSVFSNLSTRIFKSYLCGTDSAGNLSKTLSSSFLTPLLWTFSTGLALNFPGFFILNLGISAAKFTLIYERAVYDTPGVQEFYGVPKEKNHTFEYGLSMHLLVDKSFLKCVSWNCDLQIFKNYRKPVDLIMKNLVGFRINKFMKTSLQTRLYYERDVSKCIQVENIVSLGFYLNL